MIRRVSRPLRILQARNVLVNCVLQNQRYLNDSSKIGKGGGGIETYNVKLLQVNKGKEARILELTAQIEAIQMQIKALEKAKSAEAKSAMAELEVILKDIKNALRKLRMNK